MIVRRAVVIVAAATLLAALLAACGHGYHISASEPPPVTPRVSWPPATTTTTTTAPPFAPPTVTAATHGTIPRFAAPGGAPIGTVPGAWYGYPSILPVIDEAAGPGGGAGAQWVEVRLAQRPNESTAWVRASDVTLGVTPYRIVVDVTTMSLFVYEGGRKILAFPAGVGTPTDPTVTGHFFVTMHYPAPSAAYGPFVLVTSAHSDAITDWEGTGDAVIAIHGPIDSWADAQIGATGARISHGCIRLHDSDLAQLAMIPPGTPLDVVA